MSSRFSPRSVVGVVLGAGYGTRLQRGLKEDSLGIFREDVDKTKPLLTVGGFTVANHWINQFHSCTDIGPIIVVCNDHYKHQFEEWLNEVGKRDNATRKQIYLISDGSTSNENRKGAIYAMQLACSFGRKICEENENYSTMSAACIVAGDTLLHFKHIYSSSDPLSFDLTAFINKWKAADTPHDALIAYELRDKNETVKRGILEVNEQKIVTNFLEKPLPTETESRLACPPLYGLRTQTVDEINDFFEENENLPLDKKDSPGTFIQWLINRRKKNKTLNTDPFTVSLISGRFDIGNIDQYKHAVAVFGLTDFAMKRTKAPQVAVGKSYARVGFFGNPSDGYNGKTISFTVENFYSEVIIREAEGGQKQIRFFEISEYSSLRSFSDKARAEGYCGGLRLLKAASAKYFSLCEQNSLPDLYQQRINGRGFDMYFRSCIPLQVGLAGSSAIVCATFRALSAFYQIPMNLLSQKEIWPQHILDVEVKELGIAAGLQDRVAQFYEGLVFMDFNRKFMEANSSGAYESLSLNLLEKLPSIYIAYLNEKPSSSGIVHVSLRQRYQQGEPEVLEAMTEFAAIAEDARQILVSEDLSQEQQMKICDLIDKNFALRRKILGDSVVGLENVKAAAIAKKLDLACKFTGSGGAFVCVPRPTCDKGFDELKQKFADVNISLCKVQPVDTDYPFMWHA